MAGLRSQQIRYCTAADGARVAYALAGAGPPLVKAANWLTHLDQEWRSPVWQHWLDAHGMERYRDALAVLLGGETGTGGSWQRLRRRTTDMRLLKRIGISIAAAVATAIAVAIGAALLDLYLTGMDTLPSCGKSLPGHPPAST